GNHDLLADLGNNASFCVTGPIRWHLIPFSRSGRWPEREEAKALETGSWFDSGLIFVLIDGSGSNNVALYGVWRTERDPCNILSD
ncbi:hypothetical protein, partial [Aeromonas salmonicida]|uniref:hypothetical protein n=1 Tax=Aeromonas salmonicida TaxID=645 RepID=UPI00195D1BB1